jgi:hypothetical protein
MATTHRPSKWLSEKAEIVAKCNSSIQNQVGKRREEKVLSGVTAGKPACDKDFRLYWGEERYSKPPIRLICCRMQLL